MMTEPLELLELFGMYDALLLNVSLSSQLSNTISHWPWPSSLSHLEVCLRLSKLGSSCPGRLSALAISRYASSNFDSLFAYPQKTLALGFAALKLKQYSMAI